MEQGLQGAWVNGKDGRRGLVLHLGEEKGDGEKKDRDESGSGLEKREDKSPGILPRGAVEWVGRAVSALCGELMEAAPNHKALLVLGLQVRTPLASRK